MNHGHSTISIWMVRAFMISHIPKAGPYMDITFRPGDNARAPCCLDIHTRLIGIVPAASL